MADSIKNSDKLFGEALRYIPGGVNSPVRAFKAIGGTPVFFKGGRGSRLFSEEGAEYIDYSLSWGALIFGHAYDKTVNAVVSAAKRGTSFGTPTAAETELAALITSSVPSIEQLRMTSSGTEAVMGAVRLARGYTGKNKIIKFEGAYHGHADYLLAGAGSGAASFGIPSSAGVPDDFVKHTITLPFNDISAAEKTVKKRRGELAAVIVEPVMGNCGVIPPSGEFLHQLRRLADSYGFILIFDEVITGFRLALGGAQEYYGVEADLTCLGKIIGGGLPAGAFGGPRRIMKRLAPDGDVYQAGTLSGNPLSVAAGLSVIGQLKKDAPYAGLEKAAEGLTDEIASAPTGAGIDLQIGRAGSMFSVFFTADPVRNYSDAKKQDVKKFAKFYHGLLNRGVYLSPSPFEADFMSAAHSETDIRTTALAAGEVLKCL